jgi:acyl-CoA reductase-like NAD-dependent aldehyde dehydrogenase
VFTTDVERARDVAGQMRTGAIGHNGFKSDFDMGHGGFKQSGIGREGGIDGLLPFLESKAMLLDTPTARYADAAP